MALIRGFNDPFFNSDPVFDTSLGNVWHNPFGTSLGRLSSDVGLGRMSMPLQISETDDMYKVKAELPGIGSKKDIELKMDQGILSIKAEKKKETTEEGEFYHREEFSYGVSTRQVRLPDYVDLNVTPSATFDNGVLSIDLKKMPQRRKDKAIDIQIS